MFVPSIGHSCLETGHLELWTAKFFVALENFLILVCVSEDVSQGTASGDIRDRGVITVDH